MWRFAGPSVWFHHVLWPRSVFWLVHVLMTSEMSVSLKITWQSCEPHDSVCETVDNHVKWSGPSAWSLPGSKTSLRITTNFHINKKLWGSIIDVFLIYAHNEVTRMKTFNVCDKNRNRNYSLLTVVLSSVCDSITLWRSIVVPAPLLSTVSFWMIPTRKLKRCTGKHSRSLC